MPRGSPLSVAGGVTISQPTAAVTAAWNINQGSATVGGSVTLGGTNTTTGRIARIASTTGSLSIAGNLIYNCASSRPQSAVVDLSTGGGTGALTLGGALSLANGSGTLLPGSSGSTVNYAGTSVAQSVTLASSIAYNRLSVNNTSPSGATLSGAVTPTNVSGDLRVQSGVLSTGGFAVTGAVPATFEVADGATFRLTGASGMAGGFGYAGARTTEYGGVFRSGRSDGRRGGLRPSDSQRCARWCTGHARDCGHDRHCRFLYALCDIHDRFIRYRRKHSRVSGAGAQTVPAFPYDHLVISGSRGAASITVAPSGSVGVAGVFSPVATFTSGGYLTAGSTIDLRGGNQAVPLFPYHHLALNGSGTKSAAGTFTAQGDFTIGAGTTFNAASFTHVVRGNLTVNGIFTGGTGTLELGGSSIQQINGASFTATGLTVNNPAGVALNGLSLTVDGNLSLQSGTLSTGPNEVAIGPAGSVSRVAGHVAGTLRKPFSSGSPSRLFEIGGATSYTPVTLSFAGITTPGSVAATSLAGDHPEIAASGIKAARSVNRYYRLTNNGVTFTTASSTFGFTAADIDPGANTAAFVVRRYVTPAWFLTTTGTRTGTSTQATGLTALGEFAVGEGGAPYPGTSLVDAVPGSIPANGTSTSTVTVRLKDDQGNNITGGGDAVTVTTSNGSLGSVTDNGNGTYSAILTSSTIAGPAVLRSTVNGAADRRYRGGHAGPRPRLARDIDNQRQP